MADIDRWRFNAVGLTGKDGRLLEAMRVRGARGEDLGEVGEISRLELLVGAEIGGPRDVAEQQLRIDRP